MQVLSPDFSRYLCHSIKILPDAQGQNDAHGTCAAELPGICDVNLVSHTMGDGISPSAWSRGICKRENPTQGAPARAQCPTPAAKSAPSAAGGGGPKPLPTPMVLWVQSSSESHEGAGRAPPGSKKNRPKVHLSGPWSQVSQFNVNTTTSSCGVSKRPTRIEEGTTGERTAQKWWPRGDSKPEKPTQGAPARAECPAPRRNPLPTARTARKTHRSFNDGRVP